MVYTTISQPVYTRSTAPQRLLSASSPKRVTLRRFLGQSNKLSYPFLINTLTGPDEALDVLS